MRIEIRNDKVMLDGYVNAVGRDSKPIITPHGKVVEQIEPRAFERALGRAENVEVRLNHKEDRVLGSTKDKNAQLFEDNIGLRAIAEISDPEVMEKARSGKLKGWSFGMYVVKDHIEQRSEGIPRRHVEDLDIFEVSIIDDRMSPAYVGTSIEQRAEKEVIAEQRTEEFKAITEDLSEKKPVDFSLYEEKIKQLKGESI